MSLMENYTIQLEEATLTADMIDDKKLLPVNVPYILSEILVAIIAVVGNAITLYVFVIDRKLRRLTNYYIASLALADLLVGIIGVPFAIMTSLGLPRPLWACLVMLSFLMVLCTISIFCLVAVSIDRYWAILYPLVYSRVMTGKLARRMILMCWCAGTIIGLLPVFGWHEEDPGLCLFTKIMSYDYLVFLYFFTIVGPGVLMAIFYAHIYSVVLKQAKLSIRSEHGTLRQIATQEISPDTESLQTPQSKSPMFKRGHRPSFSVQMDISKIRESFRGLKTSISKRKQSRAMSFQNPSKCHNYSTSSLKGPIGSESCRRDSGTSLVGQNQLKYSRPNRREVKAAKNLSIIVLFFFICWFPLYTINCVQAFCNDCPVNIEFMFFTIILSHANSAINPILYAYHMKDFRRAFEVHFLHRLGLNYSSFKSQYNGAPLSPHYSTVLQVNLSPNTTLMRPDPSPFLGSHSFYLPSSSTNSKHNLNPLSPSVLGQRFSSSTDKSLSLPLKPINSSDNSLGKTKLTTNSLPPLVHLLPKETTSHQLENKLSKMHKFRSLNHKVKSTTSLNSHKQSSPLEDEISPSFKHFSNLFIPRRSLSEPSSPTTSARFKYESEGHELSKNSLASIDNISIKECNYQCRRKSQSCNQFDLLLSDQEFRERILSFVTGARRDKLKNSWKATNKSIQIVTSKSFTNINFEP